MEEGGEGCEEILGISQMREYEYKTKFMENPMIT